MAKKSAGGVEPKSFEDAVAELEALLEAMENNQISLEQSLISYERGTFLLTWCRSVLGQAEQRIETLAADVKTTTPATDEPGET